MFKAVALFELRLLLRSPVFWIGFVILFLLTFGAITVDEIQIGSAGNVKLNSPYAIAQTLGIMSVFGIFVATAFVAGAVIRDDETGFAPLLRSTRVGKPAYVLGRFTGATLAALLVMAAAPLGMAVGALMPWLDPERLGPQRLDHYVMAYLVYVVPTLLVVCAAFFALATATRNLMWTYVGAVASLVGFIVSRAFLRDPALDRISAWTDPFGLSPLSLVTKYWTAAERNAQLPPLEGLLLGNRLLWLGVAAVLLSVAYVSFRMDGAPLWRRRATPAKPLAGPLVVEAEPEAPVPRALPAPQPEAARFGAFMAMARFDARAVFRSPAFFVLLAIGVLNSWGALWYANQLYGTEVYPVTRLMVQALEGSFTIIPIIIAIFYAGELVWRDRQQRMHEIVDATVASDVIHVLPKVVAIVGVLLLCAVVSVLTAVTVQAVKGFTQFELLNYLVWYMLPQTLTAALLAVLAVFVQTLVPNKMIGWAVMLVYVVATTAMTAAGFEHNLYQYAGTPAVPLSDMNGQGHFWVARAWFQAYWAAFAVVLLVLALVLRRRGAETRLRPRLAQVPRRLRGPAGAVLGGAALTWAGLGGWIFYNTNVLNEYVPRPQLEARLAALERALRGYETAPLPRVREVTLKVELFPRERRALTEGEYVVENVHAQPLTELHVRWGLPLELQSLEMAGATLQREYPEHGYRIYRLAPAMQPGERRALRFRTELADVGFRHGAGQTRIVDNGSFLNNFEVAPVLGMDRNGLLQDPNKRRKQGLEPELRMARLEDPHAAGHHYLRRDSDWVNARITLVTDADQIPVAPGVTVSDTVVGDRRTLVTQTEAPIQHFFSLQSGRYAVTTREHRGVALSVYHLPRHAYNVPRMLDAMAASLDLFNTAFSPYQFKQARILEFPDYASFAQAFAATVPYSEGVGFLMQHRSPEKIDMVTYITAHEIAHQWWAHQVIGADRQGSTFLSESFAQYSALMVMERLYGKDQIRRFLKYELDRYLRSRGAERLEELPLARVENQPYIHYQKGTLAMYWLKEVVGEAVVNRALQRLIEAHAFKPAPYPSSLDFLRLLREEAGPAHDALITDLFERIVLYDVRVDEARSAPAGNGRWTVTLKVTVSKRVADGRGAETEEPLDEPFDIGVFSAEPGKKDFEADDVLVLRRERLRSGTQTLTLEVDREPTFAGVDPYNKRIDRNSDDNLKAVEAGR
jgi:aminopeptidase N/ABC-type transport system involved in multi-copper enzyme maturation permease subunit